MGLKYENINIIGNGKYGENPYEISEMVGNFSREVIVFGYDEQDALDNYVDHFEKEHGWEVEEDFEYDPDIDHVYFAKGYFPIDLDNIHIKKVRDNELNEIIREKKKKNEYLLER